MGLASALALACVAPALTRAPGAVARLAPAMAHAVPILARGLAAILASAHGSSVLAPSATLTSALVLIGIGAVVSRVFGHQGATS